jgi:hypothetical protein
MQCESCNEKITLKMKNAISSNTCPFCGQSIMEEVKAEQFQNLLALLQQTTFTNRPDVDDQIREKVSMLIVTNFVFKKVTTTDPQQDIIVVNDEEENVEKPLPVSAMPAEKTEKIEKTETPSSPPRTLGQAKSNMLTAKQYKQILDDDGPGLDPSESVDFTPEEITKMFPGMTPDQAAQILANELEKTKPQTGLTGRGIRRASK